MTKGNTLRQGDLTSLKYRLFDADGDKLDISGKPATIRLMKNDFTFIAYEKEGLTVAQDDTISFSINKILPGGLYHLEVIVDDKYIFPSRADEGKFNVDKSSLGAELTIIENTGIDAVVRKAVDLINEDPSLIIDEDKLISEIIANTSVGSIEEYYQEYRDAIKEYADLKPKAEQSISKSAEALSKSQNALNVANGIDAKATNALSLSESADTLSKSVQEQFNQVVIEGDSSVEAAQARVGIDGVARDTLKERLDDEHVQLSDRLAQTPVPLTDFKSYNTEVGYWDGAMEQALASANRVYVPSTQIFKFRKDIVIRGWNKAIFGDAGIMGASTLEFEEGGLYYNAGVRFIETKNLTINTTSESSGITFGIQSGGGFDYHYVNFENILINGGKYGIEMNRHYPEITYRNTTLWNCFFKNVRIDHCNQGIKMHNSSAPNFGIRFEGLYINDCPILFELHALQAKFDTCNFGIRQINALKIASNSTISFENSNFEFDSKVTGTGNIMDLDARRVSFKNVIFRVNAESTVRIFNTSTRLDSLTFEDIWYVQNSGNEMMDVWAIADAATTASIKFLSGTRNLPRPNWADFFKSRYVDKDTDAFTQYSGTTNLKLNKKGEYVYHIQQGIPVFNDGDNILNDFMGNKLDGEYPIRIANNFYLDGGTVSIPAGTSKLVTLRYNRKVDGLFILGPEPFAGGGKLRKVVRVASSGAADYDNKDDYVILKAYEWTGTDWSDTITAPFEVEWVKISK